VSALCPHDLIWVDDRGNVCCLDCGQAIRRCIDSQDLKILVAAAKRRVELNRARERQWAYYNRNIAA
jgi:hypothetical protein